MTSLGSRRAPKSKCQRKTVFLKPQNLPPLKSQRWSASVPSPFLGKSRESVIRLQVAIQKPKKAKHPSNVKASTLWLSQATLFSKRAHDSELRFDPYALIYGDSVREWGVLDPSSVVGRPRCLPTTECLQRPLYHRGLEASVLTMGGAPKMRCDGQKCSRVQLGESSRGNTIGATGPRASERQTCL